MTPLDLIQTAWLIALVYIVQSMRSERRESHEELMRNHEELMRWLDQKHRV